jgi:hypothetical protein
MTASLKPFNLINAPLRNRLRLDLKTPVASVWTLVGDLARMSDYSAGLERVESKTDARGHCTEYTCTFKPMAPGEDGMVSRDIMLWYQPGHGWASKSAAGDAFGLSDDLHLVTVEPSAEGALLTWDAYYQAKDLTMMTTHLQEALTDIGQNLLNRFGGRLIHCYTAK